MENTKDYFKKGGLYIFNDWLDENIFVGINNLFNEINFTATYQPSGQYYGNRFQAYPTYESDLLCNIDLELHSLILNKVKEDLDIDIKVFDAFFRFVDSEELKNSKRNSKYPSVHKDNRDFAGILYFDQTTDGGTAFFRNSGDNYPDYVIGAFPNRAVMYSGNILHTPMNDFTYDKRKSLVFFGDYC